MHKLSLALIVKNENVAHFRECLESVAPFIDYYCICDNGSTDGTQEFIKEFFDEKGIEGEVHNVEWVNFGHNRTECLEKLHSKTEYIVMIDADDRIVGKPDLSIENLRKEGCDGYGLRISRGDFIWWRNQVFKGDSKWKYVGVVHEYAACDEEDPKFGRIGGNYHLDARTLGTERNRNEDGSEIDLKKKYSKDADMLLSVLTDPDDPSYDPGNARYQFYLAQSYFDSQQWEKAEEAYKKRSEMGGWPEEVFYSIYRVGIAMLLQNKPWSEAQDTFLQAWNYKPDRAEPLYQLAKIHRLNNNPRLGYLFARQSVEIRYPENDILFISKDTYDWMCLDELAASAFYMNDFDNGLKACQILIDKINQGMIPKEHHERIRANFEHYKQAMKQRSLQQMQAKDAQERVSKESLEAKKEAVKRRNNLKRKRQKAKSKVKAK